MEYLKFAPQYLFNGEEIFEKKIVIATAGGTIIDTVPFSTSIDATPLEGILSPGLINAHCHLELSHLKNTIPKNAGLSDFVAGVVSLRDFEQEEILAHIKYAELEMMTNCIVAAGDICNKPYTIPQKIKKNIYYHNFIEVSGWLPGVAASRMAHSLSLFEQFNSQELTASLTPHAPYSVSKKLWENLVPYFDGNIVSIHNQESAGENEFFEKGTGAINELYKKMGIDNSFYIAEKKRSVASYFHYFNKAATILLVHNTFTLQQDIDWINAELSPAQEVYFCLCPQANLYIENVMPPVSLFIKNNCKIVLGTDSLASNGGLNLLDEMKIISQNFPEVNLATLLKWATINGAGALHIQDHYGRIEKGKIPGLILISDIENGKLTSASTARSILPAGKIISK